MKTAMDVDQSEKYARWKGWGDPSFCGEKEKKIWGHLHRLASLGKGSKILEIGFGGANHLYYCRKLGMDVVGLEENKWALENARDWGIPVYEGQVVNLPISKNSLDAIMALDVIEHISLEQLVPLMESARQLLKERGKFIATFPNGSSPFGRYQQHGDLTHVNTFNNSSMEQLAILTGYKIKSYSDAPEHMELKSPFQWVKHGFRLIIRKFIKIGIQAYFDEPIGMAVVCVLEKC